MNEDDIKAELAQKANEIAPPASTSPNPAGEPYPEVSKNEDESFHDNLPLEATLDKMKLLDYFEVPQVSRRTPEIDGWVNKVIEWAKTEAKSSEYSDILRVINDQERVMGTRLHPDRLNKLAQFVTINQQRRRLIEMERALYHG